MKIPLEIIVCIALCALLTRFYGKRGLFSALGFAGVLLLKDVIGYFGGELWKLVFAGLFLAVCVVIWLFQSRKPNEQAGRKHHTKIRDDHVA